MRLLRQQAPALGVAAEGQRSQVLQVQVVLSTSRLEQVLAGHHLKSQQSSITGHRSPQADGKTSEASTHLEHQSWSGGLGESLQHLGVATKETQQPDAGRLSFVPLVLQPAVVPAAAGAEEGVHDVNHNGWRVSVAICGVGAGWDADSTLFCRPEQGKVIVF